MITPSALGGERSKKILIIEDDIELREVLNTALVIEGHQVVSVANGQEGLDYLRQAEPPELVILDMMMPVKDGYEFLSEQRADPRLADIPVVVMTADSPGIERKLKTPVGGVLLKPMDLNTLVDTVTRFISNQPKGARAPS